MPSAARGFTAGAGLFQLMKVKFAPQIRYSRWAADASTDLFPASSSKLNQANYCRGFPLGRLISEYGRIRKIKLRHTWDVMKGSLVIGAVGASGLVRFRYHVCKGKDA